VETPHKRTRSIDLKFLTLGHSALRVIGHLVGGAISQYSSPPPRKTRRIIAGTLLVVLGALLAHEIDFAGRLWQGQCALGPVPLMVNGSSAFYPTAAAEATRYHAQCPVAVFSVGSSSSGAGLSMLERGAVQIADSELSPEEAGYSSTNLVEHQVALIVFTVVVNRAVTGVHSLTRDQITGIYSGTIANWSMLGGPDLAISVIGRPADSGTQASFTHFVLDHPTTPASSQLVESGTSEVIDKVRATPGAIGYVDLGAANQAHNDLTLLAIDGYPPTLGLVKSGTYPFWAIERMYTKTNPDVLSVSFIQRVISDIQTSDTFVRVSDVPDAVLGSHE
jgi:phosphate transport system substrate-binding protein